MLLAWERTPLPAAWLPPLRKQKPQRWATRQQPADPRRMRPTLQCDPLPGLPSKVPLQRRPGRPHPAFLNDFAIPIDHAVATEPIPQIDSYRHLWPRLHRTSVTLSHWLVSFALSSACGQLTRSARPAVSSHLTWVALDCGCGWVGNSVNTRSLDCAERFAVRIVSLRSR